MQSGPPKPPIARIVSAVPGRVRLRLSPQAGGAAWFAAIARQSLALPGVVSAAANPLTGGLLLRFRGELDAVLAAAEETGLFRLEADHNGTAGQTLQAARLGAALFGLLAAVQAVRGAILPPATTLLWYAGSLMRLGDGQASGSPPVGARGRSADGGRGRD